MKPLRYIILCLLTMTCVAMCAQVSISGTQVVNVKPEASTGLQNIYVLENSDGAYIEYKTSSNSIAWQRFSNLGGGFAEDCSAVEHVGDIFRIKAEKSDMGYIITDGSKQTCFWVFNYSNQPYAISAIAPQESDCDRVWLSVVGSAPEMVYHTINGRREVLSRDIELKFNNLQFDSELMEYVQTEQIVNLESALETVSVSSPLCDTQFTICPDRFAREFGVGHESVSSTFQTKAVQAQTTAVQTVRESSNEQKVETENLGGSAPCEIAFKAAISDAAIFHRWEIASTPDFIDVYNSYDDLDFTYTFTDAGTVYVRFLANNAEGTCEFIGETYTVTIGESRLDCPNAFSPGTSEGVNDEWKVSYRSIISFQCDIFNRWGKKLASFSDPSQGWDGKVGGKVVPSGVYFYVIQAKGADGKEYKLAGDINVISSRKGAMMNQEVD